MRNYASGASGGQRGRRRSCAERLAAARLGPPFSGSPSRPRRRSLAGAARSLERAHGGSLDLVSQHLVQAIAGHDAGLGAEDAGRVFFDVHEFVETKLALGAIEKRSTSELSPASPRAVEPNRYSVRTPSRFSSASCSSNRPMASLRVTIVLVTYERRSVPPAGFLPRRPLTSGGKKDRLSPMVHHQEHQGSPRWSSCPLVIFVVRKTWRAGTKRSATPPPSGSPSRRRTRSSASAPARNAG